MTEAKSAGRKSIDFGVVLLFLATFLFAFGLGIVATRGNYFPVPAIRDAKRTFDDLRKHWKGYLGLEPTRYLVARRYPGSGVTVNKPGATPGYTLLSGMFDGKVGIRLLGADGSVVRDWPVDVTALVPDQSHIEEPSFRRSNNWEAVIHGAHILPDGGVIFNFEHMALIHLDRCGKTVWTVPTMSHHSVDVSPDDGTIWVPGMAYRQSADPRFPLIKPPFREDLVLNISRDGKILQTISVLDLFARNQMLGNLLANFYDVPSNVLGVTHSEDLTHLNDVEVLSKADAERFKTLAAGDLLISLRNINTVMVFDPKTLRVKWIQTGPWLRQHDPDFQADGSIVVFDNRRGAATDGSDLGGSRLVKSDPANSQTSVVYESRQKPYFYTDEMGKHQSLPSGNSLLTETYSGRAFEVSPQGELLWEYINGYDDKRIAHLTGAARYPVDYFSVTNWSCE